MPNRILREGILTSERVAKLNWAEEVFYRRLMSVVDDFGRYFAAPKLLRAACFPLQIDSVSDRDVEKWLAACQGARLVTVYTVADKRCLQLLDFRQQVRAKVSKFPAPDEQVLSTCAADAAQPLANAHLDGDVFGDGDGDGDGRARKRATRSPKASKTTLPDDFGISPRVEAWAKRDGYERLPEHLEAFKRKCSAKGYEYASWDDAFMEAVREDWAKLRNNVVPHPATSTDPSPASQRRLA